LLDIKHYLFKNHVLGNFKNAIKIAQILSDGEYLNENEYSKIRFMVYMYSTTRQRLVTSSSPVVMTV